jgi:carbon monoxide dehydrogenase subunit G
MEFQMEAALAHPPQRVWLTMMDIPRIAACIPGCEQVEEQERMARYSAVMKQKIGPFRLEVPAEVKVLEHQEPCLVRVRATGTDKFTRTLLEVDLDVTLVSAETGGCALSVRASLQVAGRLASLGYGMIKKKADENFAEFEKRFRAQLEAI